MAAQQAGATAMPEKGRDPASSEAAKSLVKIQQGDAKVLTKPHPA